METDTKLGGYRGGESYEELRDGTEYNEIYFMKNI